MGTEHTAMPWEAACWSSHVPNTIIKRDPTNMMGTTVIAKCETVEDAAFIALACNSHDKLVRALQLRKAWDDADESDPIYVGLLEQAQEQEDYRNPTDWVSNYLASMNSAALTAAGA